MERPAVEICASWTRQRKETGSGAKRLTAIQAVDGGSSDMENRCAKLNHNKRGGALSRSGPPYEARSYDSPCIKAKSLVSTGFVGVTRPRFGLGKAHSVDRWRLLPIIGL
jgi:hypothetical protein